MDIMMTDEELIEIDHMFFAEEEADMLVAFSYILTMTESDRRRLWKIFEEEDRGIAGIYEEWLLRCPGWIRRYNLDLTLNRTENDYSSIWVSNDDGVSTTGTLDS
jgi:hypothetical protein